MVVHLDAVNFAVPQYRDRIFMIGTSDQSSVLNNIERELKSIKQNDKVVRDVLSGLPRASVSPKNHSLLYRKPRDRNNRIQLS